MTSILPNSTVLITGGTGTLGRALARHLLSKPNLVEKVIIFSRDEYKQFEMSHLPEFLDHPKIRFFIGDVRDKERLMRAFDGIDIVVHAAALKQVPSCEYNPFEAIKTNIHGAQNVIDAAIDRKVKRIIAISTDKACSPINLYGATKLCSDKLFISGNTYVGTGNTRFSVVRYGNVAGSRGSVIPFFRQLLSAGAKSLPVTDIRMTRFWLKQQDAVDMVLYAIDHMKGGELFVKKAPSFKITDLVTAISPTISIKNVGIRPGEKIHESMISSYDARNTVEFANHYIIQPEYEWWNNEKTNFGGKLVTPDFEYHSGSNPHFLTVKQLKDELRLI